MVKPFLLFLGLLVGVDESLAVVFVCHLEGENATVEARTSDGLNWRLLYQRGAEFLDYETVHVQSIPIPSPPGFTLAGHANTSAGVLTIRRVNADVDVWWGTFAKIENSSTQLFIARCLRSNQ